MARATTLERENLEAHVDLCEQRYNNLELRLSKIETKVEHIHADGKSYRRCYWYNRSWTAFNHSRNTP